MASADDDCHNNSGTTAPKAPQKRKVIARKILINDSKKIKVFDDASVGDVSVETGSAVGISTDVTMDKAKASSAQDIVLESKQTEENPTSANSLQGHQADVDIESAFYNESADVILIDEDEPVTLRPDSAIQNDPSISNSSHVLSLSTLPENVRARLREMLFLLDQNISQLVQEAEPVRKIYKQSRGHLPTEVKNRLHRVAFIESYQLHVEHAQHRPEERIHQVQLVLDREVLDSQVVDLDNRIQILSSSRPEIVATVDRMKSRRVDLLAELKQLEEDLSLEEKKLSDLPNLINSMGRQKYIIVNKAQNISREERPISGSADADRQKIEKVDQLHLDAINVIHSLGIA